MSDEEKRKEAEAKIKEITDMQSEYNLLMCKGMDDAYRAVNNNDLEAVRRVCEEVTAKTATIRKRIEEMIAEEGI